MANTNQITLLQAISKRDDVAIKNFLESGLHPLNNFQLVVRMEDDAVEFILKYADEKCRQILNEYKRTLILMNRFPMALAAIEGWLLAHPEAAQQENNADVHEK